MSSLDARHWVLSHLIWVAAVVVGIIGFRYWVHEHDQNLVISAQVKAYEATNKTLQEEIVAVRADAAKQKADVQAVVKRVKTPAQAIEAIPTVTDLPLRPVAVDDPTRVSVDATVLFQGLAQCKQDKIDALSCSQVSAKQDEQIKQKDLEIAALKRKPRFWARVKSVLKTAAISIAVAEGIRIAGGKP